MESVAAVGARIDAIESRLASLSGLPASASVVGRTAATAGASLLPAGAGTTNDAAGAGTFAAALAAARGGAPTTSGAPSSSATFLAGLRPAALGRGVAGALAGISSSAVTVAPAGTSGAAPAAPLSAAALKGYGNGRIPPEALAPIGGGERLWAPAAAAFTRLEAAAGAAGVRIGVNDSYRSFDEQVDVARRKGLYSAGGLAARPGTSDHGWGRAVDLQLDARAQSWMRAHGAEFGFAEDTPREPWHWAYQG